MTVMFASKESAITSATLAIFGPPTAKSTLLSPVYGHAGTIEICGVDQAVSLWCGGGTMYDTALAVVIVASIIPDENQCCDTP